MPQCPIVDIPCDHPPEPDQFTCQKYAKNLIAHKPFMIIEVWIVGNPYLGIISGLSVMHPRQR